MFYFRALAAIPHFRKERLLAHISYLLPQVTDIKADSIYLANENPKFLKLSNEEKSILFDLLPYTTLVEEQGFKNDLTPKGDTKAILLVLPRYQTQSSWSSRATDVIKHCNLQKIKRMEYGICYTIQASDAIPWEDLQAIANLLHDPLTETVLYTPLALSQYFMTGFEVGGVDSEKMGAIKIGSIQDFSLQRHARIQTFDILQYGQSVLELANQDLDLKLSRDEIHHLFLALQDLQHNPTDIELKMFAILNSESCRHKVFAAQWIVDGVFKPQSLLSMIKNTFQVNSRGVLSAYRDHAAIIAGGMGFYFYPDPKTHDYGNIQEQQNIVLKVETQNQFTGLSPYSIAEALVGSDLRDEVAAGRGASPKAGLLGYSLGNLLIPGFVQPWEFEYDKPRNLAVTSALDIILDAELGSSQYANEVGRPNICGYFRTFEIYTHPIFISGGLASIRPNQIEKQALKAGMQIGILGGPAMLIGVLQELFSSVQRGNAEMEKRCQEVINTCISLGENNPIVAIHDVGTGGLANSIPEFLYAEHKGGKFNLHSIPKAYENLSVLEVWCNEAPERYIIVLEQENVGRFQAIAKREACPFSIIGEIIEEAVLNCGDQRGDIRESPKDGRREDLRENSRENQLKPIHLPLSLLFDTIPRERREILHTQEKRDAFEIPKASLSEITYRLLKLPCIADKSFLINIQDRSATGLVARDQMVGPWQVPVADCGVTARDFFGFEGEAMAIGERPLLALINPVASARMAVGEAITNIAAASIGVLSDIRLSANWIGLVGDKVKDAGLYDAVQALSFEFCPALNLTIPLGKDSLSRIGDEMKEAQVQTKVQSQAHETLVPLTVIMTAFAPVMDIRHTLTPLLDRGLDRNFDFDRSLEEKKLDTRLLWIDLALGQKRLGGSAYAQVFNQVGDTCPDLESPQLIKSFFAAIQQLNLEGKILAYHDRSDGGLIVCLTEMAFASHVGLNIDISLLGEDPKSILLNEELGAVIQVKTQDLDSVIATFHDHQLMDVFDIGTLDPSDRVRIFFEEDLIFDEARIDLQKAWSETSYQLQALRDNPRTAKKQFECIQDKEDPGLNVDLNFDPKLDLTLELVHKGTKPKVAILREQGSNGHKEMAAAFFMAGFDPVDVHINDLASNEQTLKDFQGLAFCSGFSFGDAFGAGRGFAKRILVNENLKEQFQGYFNKKDTFTLGVGNGAQVLTHLKSIIPGADLWPNFLQNHSEQFECRLCLVEIEPSPSIFLKGMEGSRLLAMVAHREGYAEFENDSIQAEAIKKHLAPIRYVDTRGRKTNIYPANPNGSPLGITGLTNLDGRVTIMMPQPERGFRAVQYSWHPKDWAEEGPWVQIFRNARLWIN